MTSIKIEPEQLKQAALALDQAARRLRALGDEAAAAAMAAPSYDGQFGPRVEAAGLEAKADIQARADRLQEFSQELEGIAANFAQADAATLEGLAGLFATVRSWLNHLGFAPQQSQVLQPIDRIRAELGSTPRPTPTPSLTPTPSPTPTPTPTPTPSQTSPTGPVYWGGLSEAQMAALQQSQGARNDCAEFAIAAGLNIMYGGNVRGADVAQAADQLPGFVPLWGLRMWPNGPTSPQQQANIVNGIAGEGGFDFQATATKATPEELVDHLSEPGTAVVVTIGWAQGDAPQLLQNTEGGFGASAKGIFNGHAMLLAAYDPTHLDGQGNPAPWGFINSWVDGSRASEIYWMPDGDFREAFEYDILLMGSNNAVVISESNSIASGTGSLISPTPTSTPSQTMTPTQTPTPTPTQTPTQTPPPTPTQDP